MTFSGNSQGFIDNIYEYAAYYIRTRNSCTADQLGLDSRAGNTFYFDEEGIMVKYRNDKNLQFFGGFDSITYPDRKVVVGYVFYSARSSIVRQCLNNLILHLQNQTNPQVGDVLEAAMLQSGIEPLSIEHVPSTVDTTSENSDNDNPNQAADFSEES